MINSKVGHCDCPICKSSADLRCKALEGYRVGQTFRIYGCRHCGVSFASPTVAVADLYDVIYNHQDRLPGYSRYWTYANEVCKCSRPLEYLEGVCDVYWGIVRYLRARRAILEQRVERIVEIGSGLGYLTYALRNDGYNVTGIDIANRAVEDATRRFGPHYVSQDLAEHIKTHQGAYDVVILAEVIEHVEDPVCFLSMLLELVAPGGAIILTTPNKGIYDNTVVWDTELPPVHFWWFNEKSLQILAARVGCSVEFADFSEFSSRNASFIDPRGGTRAPIINSDGTLIPTDGGRGRARQMVRHLLTAAHALVLIRKLKHWLAGHVRLREKSYTICAILERDGKS